MSLTLLSEVRLAQKRYLSDVSDVRGVLIIAAANDVKDTSIASAGRLCPPDSGVTSQHTSRQLTHQFNSRSQLFIHRKGTFLPLVHPFTSRHLQTRRHVADGD